MPKYTPEQLKTMGKMQDPVTGNIYDLPTYKLPNETLSNPINPVTGKTDAQVQAEATAAAQRAATMIGTTYTPPPGVQNPTPAPITTGTTPPTLPVQTAPTISEQYNTSLSVDLERQKKQLQDTYQKQIDEAKKKADEAQQKINDYNVLQQENIVNNVQPLSKPFREQLENSQRETLYINQNFEANQKLTNELDSLLTEGNQLIEQQKGTAGLASINAARVNKTISDVNARAGVIQAVMNARNGQISQAYTMIDRTVNAITADRKDQLAYYSTLNDFYQNAKDEGGKALVTATADQKKFIDAQIGILESDLKTTQANADNIKKAMTDPDTALAYAEAGVTLNDTPAQINTKLATYGYAKEVKDMSNKMAQDGYTYLAPGQNVPTGTQVITTTDSKGVQKTYYKTKTTNTDLSTAEQSAILRSQASSAFEAVKGNDGYISPQNWVLLRNTWIQQGGVLKDFIDNFSVYQNPNDVYP